MSSIILAFPVSRQNFSLKLKNTLSQGGFPDVICVFRGADALQEMNRMQAGVLITCVRLSDLYYRELLDYMPDCFDLLLLDSAVNISSLREGGVMALALPVSSRDLIDTVRMMDHAAEEKFKKLRSKQKKERSEQDRNYIANAKALLMDRNHMTEEEAYRYLQKTSMDTGRTMSETAQMILLISL